MPCLLKIAGSHGIGWKRSSLQRELRLLLNSKFQNASQKAGQEPGSFIVYLQGLRNDLKDVGVSITDEDFIDQVLNNLQPDYDTDVKLLQKESSLSIEEVRHELALTFENTKRRSKRVSGGQNDDRWVQRKVLKLWKDWA